MCVAALNVSTQKCSHRWYRLENPCHPDADLSNCPERLRLAGWEMRTERCPWCESDSSISSGTHRLFGGGALSASSTLTRSSSISSSEPSNTIHPKRRASNGSVSAFNPPGRVSSASLTPLSRHDSINSVQSEKAQKHRSMNDRLAIYLNTSPHHVLPSAGKNYPTESPLLKRKCPGSETASIRSATKGKLRTTWKKSVRLSKGMFSLKS